MTSFDTDNEDDEEDVVLMTLARIDKFIEGITKGVDEDEKLFLALMIERKRPGVQETSDWMKGMWRTTIQPITGICSSS
jgi:hypothetical protein